MSRNPHASNLRHHRQQLVPDKREAALRQIYKLDVELGLYDGDREARECPTGTSAT